jgi:LacI family transcriptional regulator
MPRKPTAQDVADLAGVSRTAVSLVLNGRGEGNISAAKQKAIREAARQLNYTPNAVALSLRSRRSHTVGVLLWGGPRPDTWTVLYAALQAAAGFGYLLMIMDSGGRAESTASAVEALRARQVDGFLVIAPERAPFEPTEAMLALPTVLANCTHLTQGVTSVSSEQSDPPALAAVGEQALRLLVEEIESARHLSRAIVVEQAVLVEERSDQS